MSDLLYSADEEDLRASVRGVLDRRLTPAAVTGLADAPAPYDTGLWAELATLGLPALLVPEPLGGVGAGPREAAVVLEELGRSVAPVPFLTSAVVATRVLTSLPEPPAELLSALAEGRSVAALVLPWSARAGHWSPVSGSVRPVAGALGADHLLVPVAGPDGPELRLYAGADLGVTPVTSLDMSRPLAEVSGAGRAAAGPGSSAAGDAPVDPLGGRLLASGGQAVAAVDAGLLTGAALLASEQLGVAQWCLATTVDYAKTRIQFARPIGSFQAIKHRLADLYLEVVQAQAAARHAADALAASLAASADDPAGADEARIAAAVAQAYCSEVAVHAAEEALQLHGGIGMTWEYPVHLYLKRAASDQLALGTPARHREDLGPLVDLPR